MVYTRICRCCGKEYEATAPNSQYCSKACRNKPKTEYMRGYRDKNREKQREYMREYIKRYRRGE